MIMRAILFVFLLSLMVSCAKAPEKVVSMKEDVTVLAADDMMGRETGTANVTDQQPPFNESRWRL